MDTEIKSRCVTGNMDMIKPIQKKEELIEAIKYVTTETSRLAKMIVGKTFPIKSLTVFAHSQSEYESLIRILAGMGRPYNENNGPRVELHEPIVIEGNHITYLRIRKPDLERPQVGCCDFETDYDAFKSKNLANHPNNLRLIKRPVYEMIELYALEFKVLAYVVSE